jgi:hypothetical protein
MKFIKRTLLTILIITTVGLLFRGWFYRHLVTYKSIGLRTNYLATDKKLTDYIDANIDKQTDIDPNKLIYSKTAHCVGYASFFATTCNYLFKKYNLSDNWTAKPQIGQLYFLGTNIHKYFKSSFFKDHDFVTIENKTTGKIYAVDPTLNDYLFIDFISYTK